MTVPPPPPSLAESAVSSENETFTYDVVYLNRAPVTIATIVSLPPITEDIPSTDNAGIAVSVLVAMAATDSDDATLGLAVTFIDTENGEWEYLEFSSNTWIPILDITPGEFVLLQSDSRLRFSPSADWFGISTLTGMAWDMSGDGNPDSVTTDEFSGPFASQDTDFTIEVTPVNDPPEVEVERTSVSYSENAPPLSLFETGLTISDVDNTDLVSATLVLECTLCVTGDGGEGGEGSEDASGVSLTPLSSDMLVALHAPPGFVITPADNSDATRSEVTITSLLPSASVELFTAFLQSLHFHSTDREPSNAERILTLTVYDGTDSSEPVSLSIGIELVNDEQPEVFLPYENITFTEDSDSLRLLDPRPTITDLDAPALFPLYSATAQLYNADLSTEGLVLSCNESLLVCMYDPALGILEITGEADIAVYEYTLGEVHYFNSAEEPTGNSRRVSFSVFDGVQSSEAVSLRVGIRLINDQVPTLDPAESTVVFQEANPTSPPVAIAPSMVVTDPDSGMFPVLSVEVELLDPENLGEESVRPAAGMTPPPGITMDTSNPMAVSVQSIGRNGLPVQFAQDFIRSLYYFNSAVQPAGSNRTIVITVFDNHTLTGPQPSSPAVVTVELLPQDDLPFVELNRMVVMYSEGQAPAQVELVPNAEVIDVDDSEISGLLIQLLASEPGIDLSEEILRVQEAPGVEVSSGDGYIRVVGVASLEEYSTILRSLTYEHTERFGDPDSGNRIVRVTPLSLRNETGLSDELTVAFSAIDNPPILDLNGALPGRNSLATFTEQGEPVSVLPPVLQLVDVDTPGLEYVSISLEPTPDGTLEVISIDATQAPNITVEQDGNYILLQGDPLAPVEDFRSLLLSLQYSNTANEPDPAIRSITITASDGNNATQAVGLVTIELVNDAPMLFLDGAEVDASVQFVEEGPSVALAENAFVVDPDSDIIEIRIRIDTPFTGDEITSEAIAFNSSGGHLIASLPPTPPAEVSQLIASITFTNTLAEPPPGSRLFCFSVVDSELLTSNEACSSVTLLFINDNQPVFSEEEYSGTVRENLANTFVVQVLAFDEDSINTDFQLTYEIVFGDDCMIEASVNSSNDTTLSPDGPLFSDLPPPCRFTIDPLTGGISTSDSPPDRETTDSFSLQVIVSDGQFQSIVGVQIAIEDVNDVAPRFDPERYSASVPLGAGVGYLLAELVVVDPDLGEVDIFQVSMEPPVGQGAFLLEQGTGRVLLNIPETELDSSTPQYILTFEALDQGFLESTNRAVLVVNVTVNDADPVFGQSLYQASVFENAEIGTPVVAVMATDSDAGSNGAVSYSIEEDADLPFAIDPLSGEITVSGAIDFEEAKSYAFTVTAMDGGREPRFGTAEVAVQVRNINEFSPEFTQMVYSAAVCESAPIGYEILRVEATDGDGGLFGDVTYSIIAQEDCLDCLALNTSTGAVTIARSLDFETTFAEFRVFVQAQDGGFRFSTEADVIVSMLNDNEYPPEFEFVSPLVVRVAENYPVASPLPLAQPLATDQDDCDIDQCDGIEIINNASCSDSSDGLMYEILNGNEEGLFEIDTNTGIIFLVNSLDFDLEMHRHFALELSVSDGEFTSTAELWVEVEDSNDNLPVFENSSYALSIPESTQVGAEIITVEATDLDPTSVVTYALSGLNSDHFAIDETSGVITVARELDFEATVSYNLMVSATDTSPGGVNFTVAAMLSVSITDINDVPPIFDQEEYRFEIFENSPPTILGLLSAFDPDSDLGGEVEYSIQSVTPDRPEYFTIDPLLGALSSTVEFDREVFSSFSLLLLAMDGGEPQLSSSVEVQVDILDENDNRPLFSQEVYEVEVFENVSIGYEVILLEASDRDAGLNADLNFAILLGNELNHFAIDNATGSLFVAERLDRETLTNYTLTVEVSDSGLPTLSSLAVVVVTVLDAPDNLPRFVSDPFDGMVFENTPEGIFVLQVLATDADENAEINYAFDSVNPFSINPRTGDVTVRDPNQLDRESVSEFSFTVLAFNPGTSMSASATINIIILDENDQAPMFDQPEYVASIPEDPTPFQVTNIDDSATTGPMRFIATVTASDGDEPNTANSMVEYSLFGSDGLFLIDPASGNVFASGPLDRELQDVYSLVVVAMDAGSPQMSASVGLIVDIVDVNDNAPELSGDGVFATEIEEDVAVFTYVVTVVAFDRDIGRNGELEYSILDESVPFAINPTTGRIQTTAELDRETTAFYSFTIRVSDNGTQPLSVEATVEITVLDVNDNFPEVSPPSVSLSLPENTALGTTLLTFSVSDADADTNAESGISLSGQSSSFSISAQGELTISGPLDFESVPSLAFEVVVRNTAPPHLTTRVPVNITLTNVNDNAAVITFANTQVSYIERSKQLILDLGVSIQDLDGADVTRITDGIVELGNFNPEEPSFPFVPNTRGMYLPYDCPLEDAKFTKFSPCGIPVANEHILTRPNSDLIVRNLEGDDFSDDTILFSSSEEQYVYTFVSPTFDLSGITVATWIWVNPTGSPLTIIAKSSASARVFSLTCTETGSLDFSYFDGAIPQSVTFPTACLQLENAWHHLALVLDNTNPSEWQARVYIDNSLYASQIIATPADASGSVFVGARPVAGINSPRENFFNGRLHLTVLSFGVSDGNSFNCVTGCGVVLRSTAQQSPLIHFYDYTTRALIVTGTQEISVYEDFFATLVMVLPLFEPLSSSYSLSYTVQDEIFNCIPTFVTIVLEESNDFQPQLSLGGATVDFFTQFIEENGPVAVVNETGFSLTDGDLVAFEYVVTAEILNPEPLGSIELLQVQNVPESMNVSFVNYTLTLSGDLPLIMFEGVARTMTYNSLEDELVGTSREILFTVTDIPEDDITATTFITLVPINDAPEVTVNFTAVEYTEGDGAVAVLNEVLITDSDHTTLASANVTVSALDAPLEALAVQTTGTGISASYDATASVLQLVGSDTIENYISVLQTLTYEHQSVSDPTRGTRIFSFTVSDGETGSTPVLGMLFFASVNDAPVVDLNGPASGFNFATTFVEDIAVRIPAVSPGATIVDIDNATLSSLSITLSPVLDDETLVVSIPGQEPRMGTELVLNLEGSSVDTSVFAAVLRMLEYQNLAEEPTSGSRSITVVVSDGIDSSMPAITQVTVETRNDVPILDLNTGEPGNGYETVFVEGKPLVPLTSDNVSVADSDFGATVSTVLIVIQNAYDGLDELIETSYPNTSINRLLSNSTLTVVVTTPPIPPAEAELLLTTLSYQNTNAEPTAGVRRVTVAVSDGVAFSPEALVTLTVVSVNEHPPVFTQTSYPGAVPEGSPVGTSVAMVTALDMDRGVDGEVSYDVISSEPPVGSLQFAVNGFGVVVTTEVLDRESVDFYVLNISATDGGDPVMIGYASVVVMVIDVNDQTPVFQPDTEFELTVLESRQVGYVIDTVETTDADLGSNAVVEYGQENDNVPFSIQPNGQIVVSSQLDADIEDPVFNLTVIAFDNGEPSLRSTAVFSITVLDVNDNAPQFIPSASYAAELEENLPPGQTVLVVAAIDIDSGLNGVISFALLESSSLFAIDAQSGALSTLVALDREVSAAYEIQVLAVDAGSPNLSSTATVTVSVIDVNDNPPVFDAAEFTGSVAENSPIGTSVLQVSAQDGDAELNDIVFSLEPTFSVFSTEPLFAIDAQTGVIFVSEAADFELSPAISFEVYASNPNSSFSDTALVTVSITDENDNAPMFSQRRYQASVVEEIAREFVATVQATDADSEENGRITYSILNDVGLFSVDPDSGEIWTVDGLDFEEDCFLQIVVQAQDSTEPFFNATALVEVEVTPVDDIAPVFSPDSYTRSITEELPVGVSVVMVTAMDMDLVVCTEIGGGGMGGSGSGIGPSLEPGMDEPNIQYSLLNNQDTFTIDSATGLITTLITLDREVVSQYTIRVQASDPSDLTATASVTVMVLDINDNFPAFFPPSYIMAVAENSPIGATVLQVTASDPDFTDQGRLLYSLEQDHPTFLDINPQTGEIFVSGDIDFELIGSNVTFTVLVRDTAQRLAAALVEVLISDVNDLPPSIDTLPRTLVFTEGEVSVTVFPDVAISDPDTAQFLCRATVELDSPETLNAAALCACTNTSDASSCGDGCFEFVQISPAGFPGSVTQSNNGQRLVLEGNYSIETYEAAIESIQYINIIFNPIPEIRTISLSVSDCILSSNTLAQTIDIQALNVFPPVLDLNGPDEEGIDFTTVFRERGAGVALASPNATITDADTVRDIQQLTGLDVWIANVRDGSSEAIYFPSLLPTGVTLVVISPQNLSFSGAASLATYQQLLLELRYVNSASEPNPETRMVRLIAHEYHTSSEVATAFVTISTINDHPPDILTDPPFENNVVAFEEGSSGVFLAARDAFIDDMDSTNDPVIELQVYLPFPTQYDYIFLEPVANLSNLITVTRTSDSALTFSGEAPRAEYDIILRSLLYRFRGDEFDTLFPQFIYIGASDLDLSLFSAVQVTFDPVNDQMPLFTRASYDAQVPENATVGYSIVQVEAVDGDRFSEADIRYAITAGNEEGLFSISPLDGVISLNRSLDFEMTPLHRLLVSATDLNFAAGAVPPSPPDTAIVSISITDVNDHVPMFDPAEYNATVGEGIAIGSPVLQLLASDRDSELHSQLEFEIFGSPDFSVDRSTGVVQTAAELDRETTPLYELFATVRNPDTAAFDVAMVTIVVLDLDDNAPVLIIQPEDVVLREPATAVAIATDVSISDRDPDPSLDYALVEILSGSDSNVLVVGIDSLDIDVFGNGTARLEVRGERRSLEEYTRLLSSVYFVDPASEPDPVERTIAFQVGSNPPENATLALDYNVATNGQISNVTMVTVSVELINDNPPMLTLDEREFPDLELPACASVPGSYSTVYPENSPPVPLSDGSLEVRDPDAGMGVLEYAVVEIVGIRDPGMERIGVTLSDGVTLASGASDAYRLVLQGPASLEDFETVLRSVR